MSDDISLGSTGMLQVLQVYMGRKELLEWLKELYTLGPLGLALPFRICMTLNAMCKGGAWSSHSICETCGS